MVGDSSRRTSFSRDLPLASSWSAAHTKALSLGMFIHDFISKDVERFRQLCQKYDVGAMYAFGSAGREDFDAVRSDIDVLVEVDENDPLEKGEKLLGLWDALEAYFGRRVDLLTESSLQNPYLRKQVEATKKQIYDGRSTQVFV